MEIALTDEDILGLIFRFLKPHRVCKSCSLVNQTWLKAARSDVLWRHFAVKDDFDRSETVPDSFASWYEFYVQVCSIKFLWVSSYDYIEARDGGKLLYKAGNVDYMSSCKLVPQTPSSKKPRRITVAILIENHTNKSNDTSLWSSSRHYKHDMDVGIVELAASSSWLRDYSHCPVATNLTGMMFLPSPCDSLCLACFLTLCC